MKKILSALLILSVIVVSSCSTAGRTKSEVRHTNIGAVSGAVIMGVGTGSIFGGFVGAGLGWLVGYNVWLYGPSGTYRAPHAHDYYYDHDDRYNRH